MNKQVKVIKANGESASFDVHKLRASLLKSGATRKISENVIAEIENLLYEGITTKEIYSKAFKMLKKYSRPTAARYKLKKAIMELGPSGYPFENYVASLLEHEGFNVQVGVIVEGRCVSHEIDVIAQKDQFHYMCECKFHSDQKKNCDVKIPLYIYSRFKDVEKSWKAIPGHLEKFYQGWIFTNTRFTSDATQFGKCCGLKLISWDFPKNDGIKDRIERSGLHPLTCLTTLTSREKKELLRLGNVLCTDLCAMPQLLDQIGINERRQKNILKEAKEVCKRQNE